MKKSRFWRKNVENRDGKYLSKKASKRMDDVQNLIRKLHSLSIKEINVEDQIPIKKMLQPYLTTFSALNDRKKLNEQYKKSCRPKSESVAFYYIWYSKILQKQEMLTLLEANKRIQFFITSLKIKKPYMIHIKQLNESKEIEKLFLYNYNSSIDI